MKTIQVTYQFQDGTTIKQQDFKALTQEQEKKAISAFKKVFCKA